MHALRCSILGVAGMVALAATAPTAGEEAAPAFTDTVSVEVVNLDVFVRDRSGQPVAGLTAVDFEFFEDGKPVAISNFYAVDDGRRVAEEALGVESPPSGEPPPAEAPSSTLIAFVDNFNLSAFHRNRALGELRTSCAGA